MAGPVQTWITLTVDHIMAILGSILVMLVGTWKWIVERKVRQLDDVSNSVQELHNKIDALTEGFDEHVSKEDQQYRAYTESMLVYQKNMRDTVEAAFNRVHARIDDLYKASK